MSRLVLTAALFAASLTALGLGGPALAQDDTTSVLARLRAEQQQVSTTPPQTAHARSLPLLPRGHWELLKRNPGAGGGGEYIWSTLEGNRAIKKGWLLQDMGVLLDENGNEMPWPLPWKSRVFEEEFDCRTSPPNFQIRSRWDGYFSGTMGQGALVQGGAIGPGQPFYDWVEQLPTPPEHPDPADTWELYPRVCGNAD
jgi:hypothetical protein